jgi:hypothetical protein
MMTEAPRKAAKKAESQIFIALFWACIHRRVNLKALVRFKKIARELILERYQLGFRHDLRTTEGRQTHGWKHIRLLPESATKAIEAA